MAQMVGRASHWRRGAVGAALLAVTALSGCKYLPPDLPERELPSRTVWLDQNWSDDSRFWFHHATQGTSTIPVPYQWFMALEAPVIRLFGDPPMLADPAYLFRFGFITSPAATHYGQAAQAGQHGYQGDADGHRVSYDPALFPGNPDGLPVGFARTPAYEDPATGRPLPDQLGFTCAACHTGQMTFKGTGIRIDGAPATTDLGKFRTVLGLALGYTDMIPGRFGRFADRVLGPDHTDAQAAALRAELKALIALGEQVTQQMAKGMEGSVEEGFMRLDALNRIGTQVFYTDLLAAKEEGFSALPNLAPNNAPVNYPATWSTSWFDWVQYDASIRQPMVRNAGEALGVSAKVNLTNPDRPLFKGSVPLTEVHDMEELLAGPDPFLQPVGFKGLASPVWPADLFAVLDPTLKPPSAADVAEGRRLYGQHCASCHGVAPNDPSGAFWDTANWTEPNEAGQRYYKVPVIALEKIGTDPAQADVLRTRTVKLPAYLKVPKPNPVDGVYCEDQASGEVVAEAAFGWALAVVTGRVIDRWYTDNKVPPAERARMDGYRPNCIQAPAGYKARPLNGIWATAPFLHNGSVPSLAELLKPAAERVKKFCLGSLEFDPVAVGYDTTCIKGSTVIDTTVKGNLNTGHSFENAPLGNGVIGPALNEEDRKALLEYLKTL